MSALDIYASCKNQVGDLEVHLTQNGKVSMVALVTGEAERGESMANGAWRAFSLWSACARSSRGGGGWWGDFPRGRKERCCNLTLIPGKGTFACVTSPGQG